MDLNYIDIGILVLIFLSALVGFVRGFVREALSLTTWVAAILLAFIFSEELAAKIPFNIPNDLVRASVSFLLIFVGVLILGSLINHFFNKGIQAVGLGGLDRVLGGAFGVIRGSLVVTLMVLLLGLGLVPFTGHALWTESKLIPHFKEGAEWVKEAIPKDLSQKIQEVGAKIGIDVPEISKPKAPKAE